MKIYKNLAAFQGVEKPILTIGTFDGVHLGHRAIINQIRTIADKEAGETVLLTFHPHPRMVLHPNDHGLKLLNTPKEKELLLAEAGIDHLIIHPFSVEFSRQSALEYVRDFLVNGIGVHKMAVGYDHQFGKNREGSFDLLSELAETYGFEVFEIPAENIEAVNVSSTKIRKALLNGDIPTANEYLGSRYSLTGEVIRGARIGTEIGFPTANLSIDDPHKLIPANGVYACYGIVGDKKYPGMLNIGFKPTVSKQDTPNIEVHLYGLNEEIYGQTITLELIERMREEEKFENLDALKKQLKFDLERALQILE